MLVFMDEPQYPTRLILGNWTISKIDRVLLEASKLVLISDRIKFLSHKFLGTAYESRTLIGSVNDPENLVINLSAVDCFTFIDYVEAMRLSSTYVEFVQNLTRVRYKEGSVSFGNRNHFFSDWYFLSSIRNVTKEIGKNGTVYKTRLLNRASNNTLFLPGIPLVERNIEFIPSQSVDHEVLHELHMGDYIGMFTETEGLDVSHVGIFILAKSGPVLRHASSLEKKVVDVNFLEYIQNKTGIVILRPQEPINGT
jgi:hypothetical protein